MFDLTGKVALVTGASRGIGRATAEVLAERGALVVINYVSNEAAAREVADGIQARGGKAEILRLDVLVANAGIAIDGLLLRLKEDDFDRILDINVKGAVASARAAIKVMMRAKTGRVIFLSSVVGEAGNVGQTAYAASKAAVLGVTKSLAKEYASRAITVNAVTPGYIDTDMTSHLSDEMRSVIVGAVPLGRTGTGREVAAAIAFLASDEASYITGHVLRVNGGMYV